MTCLLLLCAPDNTAQTGKFIFDFLNDLFIGGFGAGKHSPVFLGKVQRNYSLVGPLALDSIGYQPVTVSFRLAGIGERPAVRGAHYLLPELCETVFRYGGVEFVAEALKIPCAYMSQKIRLVALQRDMEPYAGGKPLIHCKQGIGRDQ